VKLLTSFKIAQGGGDKGTGTDAQSTHFKARFLESLVATPNLDGCYLQINESQDSATYLFDPPHICCLASTADDSEFYTKFGRDLTILQDCSRAWRGIGYVDGSRKSEGGVRNKEIF